MRLLTAHKVLIIAAALLGLLLVPWGIREYLRDGEITWIVLAVAGGLLAVALPLYLRAALKKYGGKLGS